MFNPFKRRSSVPIYKRPGGWEPWNNRMPPKRMRWRPILFSCAGLLLLCGGLPAVVVFLLSSRGGGQDVQATLDPTTIIREYIDNRDMTETPDMTEIIQSLRATRTPTATAMTPTVTATVEFTEMAAFPSETPAPQITVRSFSQSQPLPTYTHYPTYTPQPVQQIIVRESGGVVVQTQIVEVERVTERTVLAPVYVVVTATPIPIPTHDEFWALQPDFFPTREPSFGANNAANP